MTLGWTDGCSLIPINFFLSRFFQGGKYPWKDREVTGALLQGKRRVMAQSKGTDVMIQLIDEAMKAGHKAKYVLFG